MIGNKRPCITGRSGLFQIGTLPGEAVAFTIGHHFICPVAQPVDGGRPQNLLGEGGLYINSSHSSDEPIAELPDAPLW